MISHQDKCLFVHIPKAAGQSIEAVFVKRMALTWQQREVLLLRPNSRPELGPPRLAHLLASEYVNKGYISQMLFEQYFKFTFVRNPWARLVSEYNYRRSLGAKSYQKDFRHFVLNCFPAPEDDNYQQAKDFYRHILPQSHFLYDQQGTCLVDFIGKFESLQKDFDTVCQQLAINSITLSHKNKTQQKYRILGKIPWLQSYLHKEKDHREYYDNDTYDFVKHFYKEDIKNFDYCFDQLTR